MTCCLSLQLQAHRQLATQKLTFHPRWNVITGANGSGKTALLEALYLLGRGRSFRSSQHRHVIQHGQSALLLYAQLAVRGQRHQVGLLRTAQNYRIQLDEQRQPQSALLPLLPVQLMNHQTLQLASDSPEARRRFMDYGVHYSAPEFLLQWQRYQQALKQCNAALRQQRSEQECMPWYHVLAHSGAVLDRLRQDYVQQLQSALQYYHQHLGGLAAVTLRYQRGYRETQDLASCLQRNRGRDRKLGYVSEGVHRADLQFCVDGYQVAHVYSRGEQKTLMSALLLAQAHLMHQQAGVMPLMLVDDLGAELDGERQALLWQLLGALGAQCFVTHLAPLDFSQEHYAFRLHEGWVQRLNQSALAHEV